MKTLALTVVLLSTTCLVAQPSPDAAAQEAALNLRGRMAEDVRDDLVKPAEALQRLRQEKSPSALKIDADADFALAALDVGRRLLAVNRPEQAEPFFKEAEKSLERVLRRTPSTAENELVQYLRTRAFIRAEYLGKPAEARADLDAALRLRPDDEHLRRTRASLVPDKDAHTTDRSEQGNGGK